MFRHALVVAIAAVLSSALVAEPATAQPASIQAEIAKAATLGRSYGRAAHEERARRWGRGGDSVLDGSAGTLLAEGDSWFNYPFLTDVLQELEQRHNFQVFSAAHFGHTLDSMAYDSNQLLGLAAKLKVIQGRKVPLKAVLISAGGNDFAGPEFSMLLNHARSALGAERLSEPIVAELINRRMKLAMITLISAITELCKTELKLKEPVPIIIHGYAHPVPDGRGHLLPWIGPWLEPSFARKSDLPQRDRLLYDVEVTKGLIDRYNAMLGEIPAMDNFKHVRLVNLTSVLSNENNQYLNDWGNEMHPTESGFERVAAAFAAELAKLPH